MEFKSNFFHFPKNFKFWGKTPLKTIKNSLQFKEIKHQFILFIMEPFNPAFNLKI